MDTNETNETNETNNAVTLPQGATFQGNEQGGGEGSTPAVTRDAIRSRIFSSKPKSKIINFYGAQVEIRQPKLDVILNVDREDRRAQAFTMLTDFTYVPGTNEKVFEEADIDALRELPFGDDMTNYLEEIQGLLGIAPKEVDKALKDAEKSA